MLYEVLNRGKLTFFFLSTEEKYNIPHRCIFVYNIVLGLLGKVLVAEGLQGWLL